MVRHSLWQKWVPEIFSGGVKATGTTFMCRLSWNMGASTSWNPQGLSRSVQELLYLLLCGLFEITSPQIPKYINTAIDVLRYMKHQIKTYIHTYTCPKHHWLLCIGDVLWPICKDGSFNPFRRSHHSVYKLPASVLLALFLRLLQLWRYGLYVVPKRRYETTILRCVKSQKSADLIDTAAEAWNHAQN